MISRYQIFGAAGFLPFLAFTLLIIDLETGSKAENLILLSQVAYASIILSFLGGIHWAMGIQEDNKAQLSFSMLPSMIALFSMMAALINAPVIPLYILALAFVLVFVGDRLFLESSEWPKGYMKFRISLTLLVVGMLIASGLFAG